METEDSHIFSIQSHIPSRQPSNPQTSSRVLLDICEFSFAFSLHNIHFLPLSVSSSQSTPLSPGLHLLILLIRQASKQTKKKPTTSSSHAKAPLDVSSHFVVAVQFWAAACVQPGESIAGAFCFVRFPGGCTRSSPRSRCSVVHLQPSEHSLQLPLRPTNYGL